MTSLLSAEARKQVTDTLEAIASGEAGPNICARSATKLLALLASLPEAPTDDQRFTELSAQLAAEIARNAEVARLLLEQDREGSVKWARGLSLRQTGVEPRFVAEADPQVQGEASDARRWQELRRRHEGKTDPLQMDADNLPMPQEPTACDFTVFMPDPTGIESLVPVGCMPGELDAAIDAAMKGQP